jgi:hypothetical protein
MMPVKPVGSAMVLTERDRRVIVDVASFQTLTGQQLRRLGHFGSKTRANTTLLRLVRHGYLSRRSLPSVAGTATALYFAGPKSGDVLERPQATVRRKISSLSDLFVAHQLLITDVRIAFLSPAAGYEFLRWRTDAELRARNLGLIPDGHLEYALSGKHFGAFVEIDRGTEDLERWAAKVRSYVLLTRSDSYRHIFGRAFFRVLVITESEGRLQHLRRVTASLTERVFWFTTMDRLRSTGPFDAIWWRPVDATLHALTEP